MNPSSSSPSPSNMTMVVLNHSRNCSPMQNLASLNPSYNNANYPGQQPNRSNGVQHQEDDSDWNLFLHHLEVYKGWSEKKLERIRKFDLTLFHELTRFEIDSMYNYQTGSEYLKRALSLGGSSMNPQKIFDALCPLHIVDMMNDPFGSSLFQKLLEFSDESQMTLIVNTIVSQETTTISESKNQYWGESMKKILETLKKKNSPLISDVMFAISPALKDLMLSQVGIPILRYCLKHLSNDENKFIYEVAMENVYELSVNKQGCMILGWIIETIKNPLREVLLKNISKNVISLSTQSFYGSYTVKKVLDLENPVITSMICQELKGNYMQMLMYTCGCHIVEKCIKSASIVSVFDDIVTLGTENLTKLIVNERANQVLQTLLITTKDVCWEFHQRLVSTLSPILDTLRNTPVYEGFYKDSYSAPARQKANLDALDKIIMEYKIIMESP